MTVHPPTLPHSLDTLVDDIFALRRIHRRDQRLFMDAMLSKSDLSHHDQALIRTVLDALQRGKLRVID